MIDLDLYKPGAPEALAELEAECGPLPETRTHRTGSGGDHRIYLQRGTPIRNGTGLVTGFDWRGDDGYVVLPGSVLADSGPHGDGLYTVERDVDPVPIPEAWERLLLGSRTAGKREASVSLDVGQSLAGLPEGQRDDGFSRLARRWRSLGVGEAEAVVLMTEAWKRAEPGYPLEDALEKVSRTWAKHPPGRSWDQARPDRQALEFVPAAELVRRVEAAPDVGFLVDRVWAADAYGVLAAEQKAGKTWGALDLAVSAASGTDWMDLFPCEQGPVLMFLGEGGERKMKRRLDAICAARGLRLADLPIRLCFRVPHLGEAAHLEAIGAELASNPAALVIIDPLYLAARGASGSQLYEMGAHLEDVQLVCQRAGAALIIIHHWNKTGEGRGAKRMSGVGPGEWGRVLISVSVRSRTVEPDTQASNVLLEWQFEGDEIPETKVLVRRRVWSDDPADLNSPLHYEVVAAEPGEVDPADDLSPAQRRVLAVLQGAAGPLAAHEIGDVLAHDGTGRPLKARTIQAALKVLRDGGLADDGQTKAGTAAQWSATTGEAADGQLF